MLNSLRKDLKIEGAIGEAGQKETTSDLSLERLQQFLEAHFHQQNAHDLCNTISTML